MRAHYTVRVRDNEPLEKAIQRFNKLYTRSGVKQELQKRQYYTKPSETRNAAKQRRKKQQQRAQQKQGR